MLNRVLILFGNESDKTNLLETGKHLQNKYGAEVSGLYIKDLRKYEVLPPTVEGIVVDSSANYLIREWEKTEDLHVKEVEKTFTKYFPKENLLVEEGLVHEVVQQKLLGFDLVVMEKGEFITGNQKELLSNHYKPILLIPKNNNLKVEKVMLANGKSGRSNKSMFSFINLFEKLDNYTSISINLEEENDDEFTKYMEIAGKKLDRIELEGETLNLIYQTSKEFDILVMGDLKHSFLVERLARTSGLKLLQNIEIPIFIG